MSISKTSFAQYVRNFELRELFNDMGWNNDRTRHPVVIKDSTYLLSGLAEKSGFRIFSCTPADGTAFPDKENRKKIERAVTKLFQEHLIVYYDDIKASQIWQLAVRKAGSPARISETKYMLNQDPELLYERASGLFFALDEEDKITIVDVTKRVSENFEKNNEVVTKKFYEKFKKEHTAFLKFIDGIGDKVSLDWYASLMLNRLMFCYFIQKQRFLDNNEDYLQDKLSECKQKKGKNKFYSFYRDFLLALFHKGLGAPNHSKEIEIELGNIPYLNGGLFDVHELEKTFTNIQIDDKAFQKLFAFFDEWNWHLDSRETASGKDINPDVIGYIFEKYINDRAQMGAYYTQEDITDYIAKSCLIPWLFHQVQSKYPEPFAPGGWIWTTLRDSADEYVPSALTHGLAATPKSTLDSANLDSTGYDSQTKPSSGCALPSETDADATQRQNRARTLMDATAGGSVKTIRDLVSFNLDIRQFAQDVLQGTDDPKFIKHFYEALARITVLDPTCGSGAFLFAAINILEDFYETCIQRMGQFIANSPHRRFRFFEQVLSQVNAPQHPNLRYFVYKSIILNNIYGVDIMNEAVEIAKLRLFLRLMGTVDADYRKPNLGLEPLPDIDFNIRAGNTIVGYSTLAELSEALTYDSKGYARTDAEENLSLLQQKCDIAARAFERYKEIQLSEDPDYTGFLNAKHQLQDRLQDLTSQLDAILHAHHGAGKPLPKWKAVQKPFHWFAEFYEIVHVRSGFDVVLGNPPYTEIPKCISRDLLSCTFKTALERWSRDEDLYTLVLERSIALLDKSNGNYGMILPLSIGFSTKRPFSLLRDYLKKQPGHWYFSHYDRIPSALFGNDVRIRCTISLLLREPDAKRATICTTHPGKK